MVSFRVPSMAWLGGMRNAHTGEEETEETKQDPEKMAAMIQTNSGGTRTLTSSCTSANSTAAQARVSFRTQADTSLLGCTLCRESVTTLCCLKQSILPDVVVDILMTLNMFGHLLFRGFVLLVSVIICSKCCHS